MAIKIVDPFNSLPDWMDPLTKDVSYLEGGSRFSPLNLMIIVREGSFTNIFGSSGYRICGWSKEPHIANIFMTPALILFPIYFHKNKYKIYILVILWGCFVLLAGSATNIFALDIVGILVLIKKGESIIKKISIAGYILLLIIAFFLISSTSMVEFSQIIQRAEEIKISGSSGWGAIQRLIYFVNPNDLFGSGLFVDQRLITWYSSGNEDIGWLSMISLLFHLSIVLFFALKLYFSKNPYCLYGLSIIYFIIHYMKHGLILLPTDLNYSFLLAVACIIHLREYES